MSYHTEHIGHHGVESHTVHSPAHHSYSNYNPYSSGYAYPHSLDHHALALHAEHHMTWATIIIGIIIVIVIIVIIVYASGGLNKTTTNPDGTPANGKATKEK